MSGVLNCLGKIQLIVWLALITNDLVSIHDIEIKVLVRLLLNRGVGVVCLNNGGEMLDKRCTNYTGLTH